MQRIVILLIVLLNIGCDQISKDIVRKKIAPSEYIQVVKNNLVLTNVENTGAMLGTGQNLPQPLKTILLQIFPIIILLILLFSILKKTNLNKWLIVAFAFVIGGGIGNLIDRVAYGSVTDFVHINLGPLKTGIFNMADVSVTLGGIFILLFSLRYKKSLFSEQ
ncbi:signal peptidase II [Saonia flava]|uniref:Lipoprotein signal peptidase n=1 Tax=Saonia flava TaxID=523696 RepID=A0A846QTC8_9FLAO|nr:signal peptidase II [Saonia flava]NJB69603.1 signal peptidase II [Saonia flava]